MNVPITGCMMSGPRERLFAVGEEPLADAELLALLLGTGTPNESVHRVALGLMDRFHGLRALARATTRELMAVPGVGPAKAARVKAGLELARRLAREPAPDRPRFASSRDVWEYVHLPLRDLRYEVFETLLVDAKNRLMRQVRVSVGTLTGSLVHPREVYRHAIVEGAAGVVFVHNHPSGDPSPSREDLDVTQRLVDGGEILGFRVLDHLIVGDDRYYSLADQGRMPQPRRANQAGDRT